MKLLQSSLKKRKKQMKVFRLCREDEVKQILNSKSLNSLSYYMDDPNNAQTYLDNNKNNPYFKKSLKIK